MAREVNMASIPITLDSRPVSGDFTDSGSDLTENGTKTRRSFILDAKKNTLLTSHGRPPWYGEDGLPLSDAFVVGIAGGSASGKTHVAEQIVQALGSIPSVVILSQDSFYKQHTEEEIILAFNNQYDFDHPDAIDIPLFRNCLADLKAGKQANIPVYSFVEHQRLKDKKYLYGAAIIITEGILALHDASLRALYDLKIFVQCDSDLMLARRIKRDVSERGRSVDSILQQYLRYVKPSYDNFVGPTAKYADIIVPGFENSVAIDLISTHIRRQLHDRSKRFRDRMVSSPTFSRMAASLEDDIDRPHVYVLPQTPQLKGIYTILRDRSTSRQDFIFFTDRLSTLLVEKALEFLPFRPKSVTTPTDTITQGKESDVKDVCGVSILRSGGPLELGLKRAINEIVIGSLLIQSDAQNSEPLLLHSMLPFCIRDRLRAQDSWVFLLDAQIGTGAAAFMAIRVLLDHGVNQSRIIFVTFLIARNGGMSLLRKAFPNINFICGAIDDDLHELWIERSHEGEGSKEVEGRKIWVIEPGMGQIGDRYYL